MPDIDRMLQDLLDLEAVGPADISRLLPALEQARARLWLVAIRALGSTRVDSSLPIPRLLTVKEVAKRLRFSPGHVYELVRTGQLRVVKNGRTIRVPLEALAGWEAAHQAGGLDDRHGASGESVPHGGRQTHNDPSPARPDPTPARRHVR